MDPILSLTSQKLITQLSEFLLKRLSPGAPSELRTAQRQFADMISGLKTIVSLATRLLDIEEVIDRTVIDVKLLIDSEGSSSGAHNSLILRLRHSLERTIDRDFEEQLRGFQRQTEASNTTSLGGYDVAALVQNYRSALLEIREYLNRSTHSDQPVVFASLTHRLEELAQQSKSLSREMLRSADLTLARVLAVDTR